MVCVSLRGHQGVDILSQLFLTASIKDRLLWEEWTRDFFLPSSRGNLSMEFTPAGATLQELFWNALGKSLRSRGLEQNYSKYGDSSSSSSIPRSLLEMPILESHPNQLKHHFWNKAQASRWFAYSPALALWSGGWGPTFLRGSHEMPMLLLLGPQFEWQT